MGSKTKTFPFKSLFPPEWTGWGCTLFWLLVLSSLVALFYALLQFCCLSIPRSIFCTYIALAWLLFAVPITYVIFLHDKLVHLSRLVDISEVESIIVEGNTVEPRMKKPSERPENFAGKKEELSQEIVRLRGVGNTSWTEYQVLSLNQMLVNFLKIDELKARARSSLGELEDYALDSAYRYDQRHFDKWQDQINDSIESIDNVPKSDNEFANRQDDAAETLRADLRTLLEHVAADQANWAKGSVVIGALKVIGLIAIFLLLTMGLLPFFLYTESSERLLSFFNWGLLGSGGAIAAVLYDQRRSNLVEVGNTDGRREIWRALLGVGLGFIAGILSFSMIGGGILSSGSAIPNVEEAQLREICLSVVWAIAAGFSFETVFDRIRSTTEGER